MNPQINSSDDFAEASAKVFMSEYQRHFCKTSNSQDVHQENWITSNKRQNLIRNNIQTTDSILNIGHPLNVDNLDVQHLMHLLKANNLDVIKRLTTYMGSNTSPCTAYHQTSQCDGRMSWIPTIMEPFQESTEFVPCGKNTGSTFSAGNSNTKETLYDSRYASSLDFSHNEMASPNTCFEVHFSNVLADLLSYVSLSMFPDAGEVDKIKTPPVQKMEAQIDSIFPPTNKSHPNADYDEVNRCYICYRIFRESKSLRTHMKRHLTVPDITCVECGKSFYESSALRKHKRIHSKHKPYACGVCSRRFNQKSNMTRHHKMHSRQSRK